MNEARIAKTMEGVLAKAKFRNEEQRILAEIIIPAFGNYLGNDSGRNDFLLEKIRARELALYQFDCPAFCLRTKKELMLPFFTLGSDSGNELLWTPGHRFHLLNTQEEGPNYKYSLIKNRDFKLTYPHLYSESQYKVKIHLEWLSRKLLAMGRESHEKLKDVGRIPQFAYSVLQPSKVFTDHLIHCATQPADIAISRGELDLIRKI